MWGFFVLFLLFFASIHLEVREVKEIQAWTEKGEAIAPPTSYLREREGGGKREREGERVYRGGAGDRTTWALHEPSKML